MKAMPLQGNTPTRRHVLATAALFIALPIATLAESSSSAMPIDTVATLITAMAAKDAATIRAAFAQNAPQAYGNGQPKSGAAFFAWLESDIIAAQGRVEYPLVAANGDEVVVTGQYSNANGYSSAANFLMVVKDGQIISWQMRY